jgi:hypothetical protein
MLSRREIAISRLHMGVDADERAIVRADMEIRYKNANDKNNVFLPSDALK